MECFHTPRYHPNHVGVEHSTQGSSFPIVSPNKGAGTGEIVRSSANKTQMTSSVSALSHPTFPSVRTISTHCPEV